MAEGTDGVVLLYTARARAGKERELKKLFLEVVTGSRHDPGNISYELHEVEGDPSAVVLYEQWISQELLDAHLKTEPLKQLQAKAKDLMEGDFEAGMKILKKLRPHPAKS